MFHFSNAVNRLINRIFQKNKCWGQDLNHQPSDLIHDELIRPQDHGVLLTSFTCLFFLISLHKINRPALYPAGQTDMQTYLHNTHTLSALCSLQLTLPTHPPQHNWIMSNLEWLPMPCNCALFGGPQLLFFVWITLLLKFGDFFSDKTYPTLDPSSSNWSSRPNPDYQINRKLDGQKFNQRAE